MLFLWIEPRGAIRRVSKLLPHPVVKQWALRKFRIQMSGSIFSGNCESEDQTNPQCASFSIWINKLESNIRVELSLLAIINDMTIECDIIVNFNQAK